VVVFKKLTVPYCSFPNVELKQVCPAGGIVLCSKYYVTFINTYQVPLTMPQAFSKYVPHVVECMASSYVDYNPIPLIKVRSCFIAHGWGGVSEVYSGLKYAVKLGYIEEVPYGRLTRYRPTLTGVVKGAIMDAVMAALGIMDERVVELTECMSEAFYTILSIDLPDAITVAMQGAKGIQCICCTEDGGCFGYRRIKGRDRVYLGMITLKVLAGVEVRGIRPRDYAPLYYFTRNEVLFHLRSGFKGFDPAAIDRVPPLKLLFLLRFNRNKLMPRYKAVQQALSH
jgi:hypothetical protein